MFTMHRKLKLGQINIYITKHKIINYWMQEKSSSFIPSPIINRLRFTKVGFLHSQPRSWSNLGNSCKGVCINYKSTSLHMGQKYSSGVKRCTECQIFMEIIDNRCPCCRTKLRTRSRNKKYLQDNDSSWWGSIISNYLPIRKGTKNVWICSFM